ncbi:FG-GAP repeat domain-containing protein [Streptomyces sp. NPDC015346]|uniref:FG-GAP repeat domain-containing protein n=1 Tax=Streptomyces sp. NPDC015346 TaxID=3364954 RepID=UPI0036F99FAC
MTYPRTSRRGLVAAICAALALTAGTATAHAGPATAATPTPASAPAASAEEAPAQGAEQQDVVPFPRDSLISGAGSTGFLTCCSGGQQWVRFADGAATPMPWDATVSGALASDAVVLRTNSLVTLREMATDTDVLTVDLTAVGPGARYAGAVGSTVFVALGNAVGGENVRLIEKTGGTQTERKVSGLRADATSVQATAGTAGHALLTYRTGTASASRNHWALLDLATATVTATREIVSPHRPNGDLALSATHVAWVEYRSASHTTVVVLDRATGLTRDVPLGHSTRHVEIGLVGRWLTYGQVDGLPEWEPHALHAVTARSLETGATRKLLDHLTSAATAPDGTQLVRGGTVARGEGLYRLSPGADGTPVVTHVASTGEPTGVALLSHNVPSVLDLDRNGGRAGMEWRLSRFGVSAKVTLRHVLTGAAVTEYLSVAGSQDDGPYTVVGSWNWAGDVVNTAVGMSGAAPNGAYTWKLEAQPLNGIGPTLVTSGTFAVARKAAPHDYTDNGSPDILSRDTSGQLRLHDTYHEWRGGSQLSQFPGTSLGSGWNVYSQIEAAGNIAGGPAGDFVARDKAGVLWLYTGKGDGTFSTRAKVGTGWGVYDKIAAGSDLTGDGRPDLLATDTAGALWLYKGTGDWRAPFSARKRIGTGWGIYNQITAVGNIAGGTAGDLLARDKAGVLWLYTGKGDGTFTARTRIGAGWNTFTQLVGVGDADRDGRADLYAVGPDASAVLYKGTGDWRAPFRSPEIISVISDAVRTYNHFA